MLQAILDVNTIMTAAIEREEEPRERYHRRKLKRALLAARDNIVRDSDDEALANAADVRNRVAALAREVIAIAQKDERYMDAAEYLQATVLECLDPLVRQLYSRIEDRDGATL